MNTAIIHVPAVFPPLLLPPESTTCQQPYKIIFGHPAPEDGLSLSSVNVIQQDDDGNIMFPLPLRNDNKTRSGDESLV